MVRSRRRRSCARRASFSTEQYSRIEGDSALKIGFIGFGEAARAFCDSLASREPSLTFGAYDILLEEDNDRACEMAMTERGVAKALPPSTLQDADWIIS